MDKMPLKRSGKNGIKAARNENAPMVNEYTHLLYTQNIHTFSTHILYTYTYI